MKNIVRDTVSYYNKNADSFVKSSINADMSSLCDEFISYLPQKGYIMDLGCGTGRDSLYFINKGFTVLPVDGSVEMCKVAAKTCGVEAQNMLFLDVDFTEEFDGIWACASLLHLEKKDLPLMATKISKALKPNGIAYMSFKYGNSCEERNGRYYTDLNEEDAIILCNDESKLEIIRMYVSGDVRNEHNGEKWINIFAKKSHN